jgi:hypothetical protein
MPRIYADFIGMGKANLHILGRGRVQLALKRVDGKSSRVAQAGQAAIILNMPSEAIRTRGRRVPPGLED